MRAGKTPERGCEWQHNLDANEGQGSKVTQRLLLGALPLEEMKGRAKEMKLETGTPGGQAKARTATLRNFNSCRRQSRGRASAWRSSELASQDGRG